MNRPAFRAVAALAAALTAGPALADASLYASISGLQFTLVDLNPFDGITPAVTFHPLEFGWDKVSTAVDSLPPVEQWGHSAFQPLYSHSVSAQADAAASVSGNFDGSMAIASSVQAAEPALHEDHAQVRSYGNAYAILLDPWGTESNFELTPFTRLVVTANFDLHAQASFIPADTRYDYQRHEVFASALLTLSSVGERFAQAQEAYFQLSNYENGGLDRPYDETVSETATLSLVNWHNRSMLGAIGASTYGTAYLTLLPVPEPSSAAMAFVGLLALAGVRRARKRSDG